MNTSQDGSEDMGETKTYSVSEIDAAYKRIADLESACDRAVADVAALRDALKKTGALHFAYHLPPSEREERVGEIARSVFGDEEEPTEHPGDKLRDVVEAAWDLEMHRRNNNGVMTLGLIVALSEALDALDSHHAREGQDDHGR